MDIILKRFNNVLEVLKKNIRKKLLQESLEENEVKNFLIDSQYFSEKHFNEIIEEIDKISLSLDETDLNNIKENLKKEIKDISDNIYNLYQSLDVETQKKRGASIQNSSKVKLSREIHKLFDSFKANYNIKESKMCVSNFREKYLKKGNEQELAKILKCNDIKALKQYLGTPDEFGYYFKFETILSWF